MKHLIEQGTLLKLVSNFSSVSRTLGSKLKYTHTKVHKNHMMLFMYVRDTWKLKLAKGALNRAQNTAQKKTFLFHGFLSNHVAV